VRYLYFLGVFIPLAVGLDLADASPGLVFFSAALGVIPTAALMGEATENLATRSGPGIGGLLNVTFGNFPELIIAAFALNKGLHEVVKASIVGSIISNILLVLGFSVLVGGLKNNDQEFNQQAVQSQAAMLLLALAALLLPAVFQLTDGGALPKVSQARVDFGGDVEHLTIGVSIVLLLSYVLGLVFSLKTHRDLFNPHAEGDEAGDEVWSVKRSVLLLGVAGVLVGVMSEVLVGSIEDASHAVGLSEFFIGVVVVAIVGNAAEHWVAVLVAFKNKIDLSMNIAIGSSAQVALFVAPVLALLSFAVGPHPMALVFNGYELAALLFSVLIANYVTIEGRSNWFEGVQLLAVYTVLVLVFLFA
jgi:Ca2+:H+ antiporter